MNKKILILSLLSIIVIGFSACKSDAQREKDDRNSYLEKNNITTSPTASGLYYIETTEGIGVQAKSGDKVTVNYSGYLLDGTKFDSSYDRNKAFEFTLGIGQVIKGWDEGIALMKEGGKATLIIPSDLAYGAQMSSIIPAYSTLVFDVELVKIN